MIEVDPDQLMQAIESQHGGRATLVQPVPVREAFDGKPVWEGVVHIFDLEDHPKTTRAYAWSSPVEGQRQAPVLCRTAPGRDTIAAGRCADGYRGGTEGLKGYEALRLDSRARFGANRKRFTIHAGSLMYWQITA